MVVLTIKTCCAARHAFLYTFMAVCGLISLVSYCWDGSIPILAIGPPYHEEKRDLFVRESLMGDSLTPTPCSPSSRNTSSLDTKPNATSPFVAPGPSNLQELIPMEILVRKVSMKERRGLGYLDHVSLNSYYQCQRAKMLLLNEAANVDERRCTKKTFRTPDHPIVALVSFHGSGNTWLRYLLEQASGIYSGAIYCDPSLKTTFPGEGIAGGSVVVVKTHQTDSLKLPILVQVSSGKEVYDKAILLVRDPFDALVSEANRRWSERRSVDRHIGLAEENDFFSSKWDWFVEFKGMAWSFMLHTWLSQQRIPVHIVQYESLISDLRGELRKILHFLGYQVSNATMNCVMANSHGKFKRTDHLNFNPFTAENHAMVNRIITQAAPLLAKYGIKYNTR